MVMVVVLVDLEVAVELAGDTELEVEGEMESAVWVVESVSDK